MWQKQGYGQITLTSQDPQTINPESPLVWARSKAQLSRVEPLDSNKAYAQLVYESAKKAPLVARVDTAATKNGNGLHIPSFIVMSRNKAINQNVVPDVKPSNNNNNKGYQTSGHQFVRQQEILSAVKRYYTGELMDLLDA